MAAYPSHTILEESTMEEEDGVTDDFSAEGAMHSRILYATRYYRWKLIHNLTWAQWQSLSVLYDAGKRDVYTFAYLSSSPSVTYNVQFTAPPRIVRNLGLNRFFVEVQLRGSEA